MEKTYKVDCVAHLVVCVFAESEKEAKEKAHTEAYENGEEYDFRANIVDEWDD